MADHERRDSRPQAKVQRKATPSAGPAAPPASPAMPAQRAAAAQQINRSLKAWRDKAPGGAGGGGTKIPGGSGSKLPGGVQKSMEQKLGADLSDVNIHTGGDSAGAAKDLNARAFTTGTDVHFGAGEYDPSSKEGKKLLAHELTHVVQAKRSGISRSEDESGSAEGNEGEGKEAEGEAPKGEKDGEQLEVSDPEEPAQKEADEVAEKVTADDEGQAPEGEEQPAAAQPLPEIAAKSIPISAKLKGIGLKIFRNAPAAAGGADPDAGAKQKAADFTTRLTAAFAGGSKASSAELAVLLQSEELKTLERTGIHLKEVQDLKRLHQTIDESVDEMCSSDLQALKARVQGIDPQAQDAAAQLQALKSDPTWLAWKGNPLFGPTGKMPNISALTFESEFPAKEEAIKKAAFDRDMAAIASGAPVNVGALTPKQRELHYKKEIIQLKAQQLTQNADFLHKLVDIGAGIGIDIVTEGTIDLGVGAAVALLTAKFPPLLVIAAPFGIALRFGIKQAIKTLMVGVQADTVNMAIEKVREKRFEERLKTIAIMTDEQIELLYSEIQFAPSELLNSIDSIEKQWKASMGAAPAKIAELTEVTDGGKEVTKKLGVEAGKRAIFDAAGEAAKEVFADGSVFGKIAEKLPEVGAKFRDALKVLGEAKQTANEIKALEELLKEQGPNAG